MSNLADRLFESRPEVRYVALYRNSRLELFQRPGIDGASSSDSDRYEELLVNPTVLTLARQRGEIDCGGLEYVVIRYGNFYQLVHPLPDGHVSIAVEVDADPLEVVPALRDLLASESS